MFIELRQMVKGLENFRPAIDPYQGRKLPGDPFMLVEEEDLAPHERFER